MLHFFEPVMFQQALELWIEVLVVFDAIHVMPLHHPLDVQRRQGYAQRIVSQYRAGDRFWWANYRTVRAKAFFKLLPEAFEELNVFCFLAGELQQSAHTVVVAAEMWPCLVQHERKNELFDETKDAQVSIASDLVENEFFFVVEKREFLNARVCFGHERLREIEALVTTDDVFNAPVNDLRRRNY